LEKRAKSHFLDREAPIILYLKLQENIIDIEGFKNTKINL
jgi:hypothetical protein